MKILFIIDSLVSGGKERQLVELMKGLAGRDGVMFELVVLSDQIHFSYVDDLKIPVHRIPRATKRDPSIFGKLHRICREFRPDIVHSWEAMCSIYVLPAVKFLGSRLIISTIRDAPARLKPFSKAWNRSRILFPFADFILANSAAGLRSYAPPPHKSLAIRNGIDLTRIAGLPDSGEVRNRFGITTPFVVGMVGRFSFHKDYRTYVLAAMKLLEKRNDVTFLAIGDGNTLEETRKIVPKELDGRIMFLGNQRTVEQIVNIFDVGVLATFTEGISNAIMEYMALSKPVVATDGGGTSEILADGETGFLVKQGDIGDLVSRIEYLLDNKERAEEMGTAGRRRLETEFSLSAMTDRFVEVYQWVLM